MATTRFEPDLFQAQFDAHEMITQRESVSQRVQVELAARAKQFGILLDDISIVGLLYILSQYIQATACSSRRIGVVDDYTEKH